MSVSTTIYDDRFFQNTIKFEAGSAKAVADVLIKYFKPHSVVDIGCGCGVYLAEFKKQGVEILGFDGAPAAAANSLVGDKIILHDLRQPLKLNKKFDLCLCVEVAEHLEAACADVLIDSLINLSDIIFFTAATPGQGPQSIGHINEQLYEYWIEKFADRGYEFKKELTEKIKQEMEEKKAVWWIVKNSMVFKK